MTNQFSNNDLYLKTTGPVISAGRTLYTNVITVTNKATGGSIGTAATTVDVATVIVVNQTTASQTLTLPSPTDTTAGAVIIVVSGSSAGFTINGTVLTANNSTQAKATFVWTGAAWV